MTDVAIIGAGAMGLAAAHHALKGGHRVTVYEGDRVPGGMAAHFDFDGISLERFYHFVCKADRPLFELMDELGLGDRMVWRETAMGYFIDGAHYPWGDPVSLLRFPRLSMAEKVRYGAQMYLQSRRKGFDDLEHVGARDWFVRWCGPRVYDLLWRPLMELKFYEYADDISAAWISTRIKRVGTSRKSILQEELGVIDGGSQTLVDALVRSIEGQGGTIRLGTPVREVRAEGGRVAGVRTDAGSTPHGQVISTVPTPYVPAMIPALPEAFRARLEAIRNIGVVCVVLKLARPVTRNFWLNINDAGIEIPGIVEFSNLRDLPDAVVYVPFYMPQGHAKFGRPDADFVAESMAAIRRLNPDLGEDDLLASHVGRLRHAQPVCEPGFAARIPPIRTPIAGLQIADTCYYYPEDRGISESVRLAKLMAADLDHLPEQDR
jgi:protoporphyrinogen oxidase